MAHCYHAGRPPFEIGTPMDNNRSRAATLLGVAAAAGAFGVAAMMAAATAPTARADDFIDVINQVDSDYAAGQAEFSAAFSDFGGGSVNEGLAAVFSGVDTDLLAPPATLEIATIDLLTNEPVLGSFSFDVQPETDFTSALTDAEYDLGAAQESFTSAATVLSANDFSAAAFADAALYDSTGFFYSVLPLQELLEAAVASF
jgi:hypothetical protein